MNKVSVVILNWNGITLLEKFLPILIHHTPPTVHIVVGDNGSTDGSVAFIEANFPGIICLVNPENLGYAGGYNKILEQVNSDYYVLLNSDVEVSKNWIEPIINYLEAHPYIAAAQPKILSYYKKNYFEYAGAAGGFMDRLGYFFCRGRLFDTLEEDLGQYNDSRKIFWASGAAFFIRAEIFHASGGFDASLFAHMEEIDLCWRLQRKGLEIAYIPESAVYHMGGQTLHLQSAKKTYLNFRNNLIILYKNLDAKSRLKTLTLRFIMDFITWLRFLILFKWNHAWAINKAHFDFLRHYHKYRCQQSHAMVSDSERGHKKDGKLEFDFKESYTSDLPGYYKNSLVWDYFIMGKRTFSDLFK